MSLTLVIGPMFSGKTSYLLSSIRKAKEDGIPTYVITSNLDKRYTDGQKIVNHNLDSIEADISVSDALNALMTTKFLRAKIVFIEEAQFYTNLLNFVLLAVNIYKKEVIIAGLDGDAERNPFGEVLELIPHADNIIKLKAVCKRCCDGTPALFTSRIVKDPSIIHVGGADKYESLCRTHYAIYNQKIIKN